MKRIRFRDPAGSTRVGEYDESGTIEAAGRTYDVDAVDVLPPCEPTKIVCIGRNYAAHAEELGNDVPDRPLLFLKPPNALAGHGDTVTLPAGKESIEHEAELGVVIGQQCRNVDAADAEDVIAGYTCVNDVSNRDDQRREQNWVRGKAFDNAAPIGPVLATPEEVPDDASVRSFVNGERRQDGSLDLMIFEIPELIAEITTYLTLEPGDVIATGTPEGVGPLTDGDAVAIEIEGVGRLEHSVVRRD
ncbi:fumarylacetoacetate hydrolase family protein [Halopenitus persicus]|uniref:2-keto-4-pentenoate hydratase/2-oxohepta-3-ene-1,7-dioic acid hydratase (Catechol pathway) n=1 Tax=Halopenitus persicus TaxID=1048396 RepID=A0A1H3FX46_9EURY|nr:fumarylacetoacetate hydrolase family protein [Halopenitus persicus]QHS16816.1 fumarylacetoacetate hydrolase family protein [haloarchaeon 3A1-DGR]SDX95415.1 2-keto-4-pentenoate hydratase/2-oxohepta-3-ene-1,7-dioic acid hydratase (catechol pathway) [Halopenitus persicus]